MRRLLTPRAARRSKWRRIGVAILALASVLVLSGCSQKTEDQWKRLGLPPPASDRSPYVHNMWIGSWIAAGIIGVMVWGLILWASFRYRRRDDSLPVQVRYNLPIEVLYTIAPIIIVAVLFFYTVQEQDRIKKTEATTDHEVQVTAQQWSWTFSYLDEPSLGGKTDVYDAGTPEALPELWLVENQSVQFDLHSPDVIHSFWVPSFYFKLDVIPGRDQSFQMTPTKLGTYDGLCAELCGLYHSKMRFEVHVVTQTEFDDHLEQLKEAGQIGAPRGASQSQTVSGLVSGTEGGSE